MKKNLYYKNVFGRRNGIKAFFYSLFISIASWPRLLLEVFTRSNMGERYFSFSSSIILTVILAIAPYAGEYSRNYGSVEVGKFLLHNLTWYAYLAAFMYFSIQRRKEIKTLPGVFDFKRFSLSGGVIDKRLTDLRFNGQKFNIRTLECLIEPAFFFIIGLGLLLLGQNIGYLITICSIIYSLSYCAAYDIGDNFIMDKIDEIICGEELTKDLKDDNDTSKSRGFNAYGRKPSDPELRKKTMDAMFENDGFEPAI